MNNFSDFANRLSSVDPSVWQIHRDAVNRRNADENVLVLSIGEDYQACDESIVEEAIEQLKTGNYQYPPNEGKIQSREKIVEQYNRKTGNEVTADQCVVFPGSQNALFNICMCLFQQGDEVLIVEPYYASYPGVIEATGAKVKSVVVKASNKFQPTIEEFCNSLTSSTKGVLINNPNNPTGAVYSDEFLKDLAGFCTANDLWLICDSVFSGLEYEPATINFKKKLLAENCGKFISLGSLSKTHRMSGWRVGWAISPLELSQKLVSITALSLYGITSFFQDAAIVALNDDRCTE